jgi:hypothetical protein
MLAFKTGSLLSVLPLHWAKLADKGLQKKNKEIDFGKNS